MFSGGVYKKYSTATYIGSGYVIIPPKVEREEFVETCLRTQTVSILVEDGGGVAHKCKVANECINSIEFPRKWGLTGTPVMFRVGGMRKVPEIFATFQKEDLSTLNAEWERKLSAITNGENYAEIGVRGKKGQAYISVNSDESDGGVLNISIKNADKTGKLNIQVQGDCNLKSTGTVDLRVTDGETEDSVKAIAGEGIVFNDNKLSSFIQDINKTVERMNLVEGKVNEMLNNFKTWTVASQDGGLALWNLFNLPTPVEDLENTDVDDIKDERIKN